MKAEIIEGILVIIPRNHTEDFALQKWHEANVNGCTLETNGRNMCLGSFMSKADRLGRWLHKYLHQKPQYQFLKKNNK